MTKKLYDIDAYLKEFEAEVLACVQTDKGFAVVLDKTAFFPEEGGQTPDKGTINGKQVLYVSIKDGIITHYLDESLVVGSIVSGSIDFEHRFSNMQMHSAEHIFSGFVHEAFGYDNVGFHLSDNDATMDYNGKLTAEDVEHIEKKVNDAIYKALKIKTWYPDSAELESLNYRSKSGIEGAVRMVEIEDIDLCACCAPHVSDTSQIGVFKIVRFESYKGGIRLHYLAGKRAFEYYKFLYDTVSSISKTLSASPEKITENIEKIIEDNKSLSFDLIALRRTIVESKIKAAFNPEARIFSFFLEKDNVSLLRYAVDLMQSIYDGICIILCETGDNTYRFIAESKTFELEDFISGFKCIFDTKCGGKNNSVQGSVNATHLQLVEFFEKY